MFASDCLQSVGRNSAAYCAGRNAGLGGISFAIPASSRSDSFQLILPYFIDSAVALPAYCDEWRNVIAIQNARTVIAVMDL
jgi:hypothetical protein